MSTLESATQPILRPLINTQRDVTSLSRAERHTVARWATKTAFALDLGGLEPRVPRKQMRELCSNARHLPLGIYVFARQQHRTQPWYYGGGAWWKHAPLTEDAAARVSAESYKYALQFGDLILLVVYWPLANWGLRIEKGELTKLWLPTEIVKEYVHPQPMESVTSERACLRYAVSTSVVPKRQAEGLA